jgi:hypothetical protein
MPQDVIIFYVSLSLSAGCIPKRTTLRSTLAIAVPFLLPVSPSCSLFVGLFGIPANKFQAWFSEHFPDFKGGK